MKAITPDRYRTHLQKAHSLWLQHDFLRARIHFRQALEQYKLLFPNPDMPQQKWMREMESYILKCKNKQPRVNMGRIG